MADAAAGGRSDEAIKTPHEYALVTYRTIRGSRFSYLSAKPMLDIIDKEKRRISAISMEIKLVFLIFFARGS